MAEESNVTPKEIVESFKKLGDGPIMSNQESDEVTTLGGQLTSIADNNFSNLSVQDKARVIRANNLLQRKVRNSKRPA